MMHLGDSGGLDERVCYEQSAEGQANTKSKSPEDAVQLESAIVSQQGTERLRWLVPMTSGLGFPRAPYQPKNQDLELFQLLRRPGSCAYVDSVSLAYLPYHSYVLTGSNLELTHSDISA